MKTQSRSGYGNRVAYLAEVSKNLPEMPMPWDATKVGRSNSKNLVGGPAKIYLVHQGSPGMAGGAGTWEYGRQYSAGMRSATKKRGGTLAPTASVHPKMTESVFRLRKADRLETRMQQPDADRLVGQYGLRGPLPKELSRDQRMAAYEARYVASGGHKGEKWGRRSSAANAVRTGGLAASTVAGAGILASRSPRVARAGAAVARKAPLLGRAGRISRLTGRRLEGIALGSAVASGGAELYGGYARHRRASYASAPGGVAASALRRMRDYTP